MTAWSPDCLDDPPLAFYLFHAGWLASCRLASRDGRQPLGIGFVLQGVVEMGRCIGIWLLLSSAPAVASPPGLESGFWRGTLGDEVFVLEFFNDSMRQGCGCMHLVVGDKETAKDNFRIAQYEPPRLILRFLSGRMKFEGEVNLETGCLQGRLLRPDGNDRQLTLQRCQVPEYPASAIWPESTLVYLPPPPLDDGWTCASIMEFGLTQETVTSMLSLAEQPDGILLHSLLVAVDGRLVIELYFHGFGYDDYPQTGSVAKGLASLLVGAAVDRGLIANTREPLLDFFPGSSAEAAPGWERLRLDQLLTMSLGLDWSDGEAALSGTGPTFFAQILARPPRERARECWRDVNADVNLLSGLLREATGMPVEAFAEQALFTPLDIHAWDWSDGAVGDDRVMSGSLRLRPRDMAKLGQLVLDRGRWNGRQVLSAAWLDEMTLPQVETGRGIGGSGYLWVSDAFVGAGGYEFFTEALGQGSQCLLVMPDRRLVLVMTGGNDEQGPESLGPRFTLIPLLFDLDGGLPDRFSWGSGP
jgi:CubicO group peptidase (beta-lactamase class C family)